jgi:hypothetical protein
MAAPERSNGVSTWWRFVNSPSVRAAPYQLVFGGVFALAVALFLSVAALFFGFRIRGPDSGTLASALGFFLLGILAIYGGIRRIRANAKKQ